MDARELEKEKIEELQANQDPFAIAATMFGMYSRPFEDAVKALSTGELRRLTNALVKYPIADKEFIDETNDALKNAFTIGQNLMEAKFIMMTLAFQDHDNEKSGTVVAPENTNANEGKENGTTT